MSDKDTDRLVEIARQNNFDLPSSHWNSMFLEHSRFVLLTEFNMIVGFAALKPSQQPSAAEVCVMLDLNFENLGIERLLLKRLIFSSESHGFHFLKVKLSKFEWERLEMYEKLYFRPLFEENDPSSESIELQRSSRVV